jgi:transcriptional/translational regulatory protein YebC/TACO1
MNLVLESGADDLKGEGGDWEILSAPDMHEKVLDAVKKAGITPEAAEIAMVPKNLLKLEGKNASGMLKLTEVLEENEDVQNVYSNFDIDEKELEAMA